MARRENTAFICHECGHVIRDGQLLKAPHPFRSDDCVYGCPMCRESSSSFPMACDEECCDRHATMGSFGSDGVYRSTCFEHRPSEPARAAARPGEA